MDKVYDLPEELIQKAKEGDQEAFGEIFEMFIAPIYRFVIFRVADPQNAEKLTEEIFLRAWKDLRKFRPHGKISFAVWIFQLSHKIVSQFLERIKKTNAARKHLLLPQENSAQEAAEEREQRELIAVFATLPKTQSEAIICKYFCHLSNAEIGLILEKTEGAIRILQSRGLKKLRELLE